ITKSLACRRLPHQGTLGAVAVPAAPEQRNHALGIQTARRRDHVAQRVVSMRVVDNHKKGLTLVNTLEASRHGRKLSDSLRDRFRRNLVGKTHAASREYVVDVDAA